MPLNIISILAHGRKQGGLFKDLQVLEMPKELTVGKDFFLLNIVKSNLKKDGFAASACIVHIPEDACTHMAFCLHNEFRNIAGQCNMLLFPKR